MYCCAPPLVLFFWVDFFALALPFMLGTDATGGATAPKRGGRALASPHGGRGVPSRCKAAGSEREARCPLAPQAPASHAPQPLRAPRGGGRKGPLQPLFQSGLACRRSANKAALAGLCLGRPVASVPPLPVRVALCVEREVLFSHRRELLKRPPLARGGASMASRPSFLFLPPSFGNFPRRTSRCPPSLPPHRRGIPAHRWRRAPRHRPARPAGWVGLPPPTSSSPQTSLPPPPPLTPFSSPQSPGGASLADAAAAGNPPRGQPACASTWRSTAGRGCGRRGRAGRRTRRCWAPSTACCGAAASTPTCAATSAAAAGCAYSSPRATPTSPTWAASCARCGPVTSGPWAPRPSGGAGLGRAQARGGSPVARGRGRGERGPGRGPDRARGEQASAHDRARARTRQASARGPEGGFDEHASPPGPDRRRDGPAAPARARDVRLARLARARGAPGRLVSATARPGQLRAPARPRRVHLARRSRPPPRPGRRGPRRRAELPPRAPVPGHAAAAADEQAQPG